MDKIRSIFKMSRLSLKFYINIIVFCIILILATFEFIKAGTINQQNSNENVFYEQILNYTLPLVESMSSNSENATTLNFNFRVALSSIIGFNLTSPLSIIGEEMSFLKNDKTTNTYVFDLNPFKLSDASVTTIKPTVNQTPSNVQAGNLPDNIVNVTNPKLKNNIKYSTPQVLIYHTHTCESYAPGPIDTQDLTKTVCAVGDTLANSLANDYGIPVLNDHTIHDIFGYIDAYKRSGATLSKYLKEYSNFNLIVDIHRDSIGDKSAVTMKMNGENISTFRFVMAKENPNFARNMTVVNKLITISNKLFPGFCKGIFYYNRGTNYFNEAANTNVFLIEVGSAVSNLNEAKASGKYLSRIFAEYLNSIS